MTIYFIQTVEYGQHVKIGTTTDVARRMSSLSLPCEVRLLATAPGGRENERMVHRYLAASRVNGEWFRPSQEVLDLAQHAAARTSEAPLSGSEIETVLGRSPASTTFEAQRQRVLRAWRASDIAVKPHLLAKAARISPPIPGSILTGVGGRCLSIVIARKIGEALGVDPMWLITGVESTTDNT